MIVVSIALCKHRLQNVKTIVNDFMSGKVKPDKIHFFISKEPFLLDEGIEPNEIPKINNPKVEFNYTENIGLIRKFIPVVKMYWDKPDTKIIIFDDDRKPQKDTVEVLNKWIEKHPNKAFTLGGYTYDPFKPVNAWQIKNNIKVHISATGVGLIVKPSFFQRDDIWNWEQYNTDIIDVRISSEVFNTYAFKKNGIPLFCVPCNSCPIQLPDGNKRLTGGEIYGSKAKPSKLEQQRIWKSILKDKAKLKKQRKTFSVVIQSYNRQSNIPIILKRIRKCTQQPNRIIIWNDNDGSGKDLPDFPGVEVINAHNTNYNHNFGAMVACWFCDTDYIALLDDDSLPGTKWFEFCLKNIKPKQIYTGLGFVIRGETYINRASVKSRVENKISFTEVHSAGNTYFFHKDAIIPMFKIRPDKWDHLVDLHFSFLARTEGYKVFVPFVSNNDELPILNDRTLPLSSKENAMYKRPGHMSKRTQYIKWAIKNKILLKEDIK